MPDADRRKDTLVKLTLGTMLGGCLLQFLLQPDRDGHMIGAYELAGIALAILCLFTVFIIELAPPLRDLARDLRRLR